MTTEHESGREYEHVADRIAAAALEHPCVVRLDGGEHGIVATHLPGRRVTGVRTTAETGEATEVCVVLLLRRPVPELVAELRERIREVTGETRIDVTVADVLTPEQEPESNHGAGETR
ncbi:hypothetical protein SAMN04487820_107135 [Actinopolyspora mzabensis]|uniref:Asp23 family, cell envelope-related function n=1 Tax=Actinopolyspora mzabensis TaxID=995066 RepID=A0A1G9BFZ5_ACTMZ|nr:hypothetical protein [Actinopolyspora mzabensis]SDK38452.1 hypothetical protein SAMN04487820_107135 [Actinopolyspora mzabensis]